MPNTVQIGPTTGGVGAFLLRFIKRKISTLLGLAQDDEAYPSICVTNALLASEPIAIINGNTTVNIPTGTSVIVIVPPTGSTVTKTIKGVAGDTGLSIHPGAPFVWPLPSSGAPTTFVITANGSETLTVDFN